MNEQEPMPEEDDRAWAECGLQESFEEWLNDQLAQAEHQEFLDALEAS